jgi:2-dehydro-3-deoxyphosphogalactonate aldolase
MTAEWFYRLKQCSLIPALRGLTSTDAVAVVEALLDAGITVLEVPLRTRNPTSSPIDQEALKVLSILSKGYGDRATVAAGTVMNNSDLQILDDLGVRVCFSLCLRCDVVALAAARGIEFIPGVETVSEVLAAIDAGAAGVKLFPATIKESDGNTTVRITPGYVNYLSRFITDPIIPAGNAFQDDLWSRYIASGAAAINIGSQLYEAGISLHELTDRFQRLMGANSNARHS